MKRLIERIKSLFRTKSASVARLLPGDYERLGQAREVVFSIGDQGAAAKVVWGSGTAEHVRFYLDNDDAIAAVIAYLRQSGHLPPMTPSNREIVH